MWANADFELQKSPTSSFVMESPLVLQETCIAMGLWRNAVWLFGFKNIYPSCLWIFFKKVWLSEDLGGGGGQVSKGKAMRIFLFAHNVVWTQKNVFMVKPHLETQAVSQLSFSSVLVAKYCQLEAVHPHDTVQQWSLPVHIAIKPSNFFLLFF